jgi:hypothetical protein
VGGQQRAVDDACRAKQGHALRRDVSESRREDRYVEFAGQPAGILRGGGGDFHANGRTVCESVRPGGRLEREATGDLGPGEH